MSNWAENPQHQRQSLMSYALPQLLFSECSSYCIDSEFKGAETAEQVSCLHNCQAKTYKAFDLYMQVNQRMSARKNFRAYVDISKFTGMEVEHKHDTESVISHVDDGHVHPKSVQDFTKVVDSTYGEVQKKAGL